MLFYKYQKPGNLEFTMLRQGEIYFASRSELNDAHECQSRMILNGSLDLWQRLADFILQTVCFESGCLPQDSADISKLLKLAGPIGETLKKQAGRRDVAIEKLSGMFLDILAPLLKPLLPPQQSHNIMLWIRRYIDRELPHRLTEDRYIASFSLTATNPTMWGHYAAAETGFVIVFTSNAKSIEVRSPINILLGTRPSKKLDDAYVITGITEIGIYKDASLELKEVKYGTKQPTVNAFHQLIPMFTYSEQEDHYDVPLLLPGDAPGRKEGSVGLVKHSGWKYEKELRAFLPTIGGLLPDARALHVASRNILGLIFGPKMSPSDVARAIVCCHLMRQSNGDEHSTGFMFFQAEQQNNDLSIGIRPVGILKESYYGNGLQLPVKPISELPMEQVNDLREIAKSMCTEVGRAMRPSERIGKINHKRSMKGMAKARRPEKPPVFDAIDD